MRSLVSTGTSTETRRCWWAYLFVLDEFIAEADATIDRPAAYNNTPAALSDRDRAFLLSVIEHPPATSEGFLALLADY
ncbi:hypothetical protein [Microcoleus sp. S28C3]|uniref:hypothetical protein n=1 Tax=Microcoleus sp. S28C3 TaxID=3055414 RepID=UPI002FD0BE8B